MQELSTITDLIEDIIYDEVNLRMVAYGDGDMEKDPDSVRRAAEEIVKFLRRKGIEL